MASLQFRDQPLPDKATKWNWDLPLMRDISILNCSVIVNFPSGPKLTVAEIFLLKNSKRKLIAVLDILKSCWHINHVDFWYMQMNYIFSEVAIQRCSYKKVFRKYAANYKRTPMWKCDFNKFATQLYWNRTSAWAFSCKFAAYFQNIFS